MCAPPEALSTQVAKDVLINEFMERPPSFVSWMPLKEGTEGNAAADVRAAMGGGDVGAGAPAGPKGGAVPTSTLSGEREHRHKHLQTSNP